MTQTLTDSVVLDCMADLNVMTTLPSPTVAAVVSKALQGTSETEIVADWRAQNDVERTTLGSLEDIRYIAEYAVAIRTIYEVVVYLGGRPEVQQVLSRLNELAVEAVKKLNPSEIKAIVQRVKSMIDS